MQKYIKETVNSRHTKGTAFSIHFLFIFFASLILFFFSFNFLSSVVAYIPYIYIEAQVAAAEAEVVDIIHRKLVGHNWTVVVMCVFALSLGVTLHSLNNNSVGSVCLVCATGNWLHNARIYLSEVSMPAAWCVLGEKMNTFVIWNSVWDEIWKLRVVYVFIFSRRLIIALDLSQLIMQLTAEACSFFSFNYYVPKWLSCLNGWGTLYSTAPTATQLNIKWKACDRCKCETLKILLDEQFVWPATAAAVVRHSIATIHLSSRQWRAIVLLILLLNRNIRHAAARLLPVAYRYCCCVGDSLVCVYAYLNCLRIGRLKIFRRSVCRGFLPILHTCVRTFAQEEMKCSFCFTIIFSFWWFSFLFIGLREYSVMHHNLWYLCRYIHFYFLNSIYSFLIRHRWTSYVIQFSVNGRFNILLVPLK